TIWITGRPPPSTLASTCSVGLPQPRSRMADAARRRMSASCAGAMRSTSVCSASAVLARASWVSVSPLGPTRGERPPGLPDWPFLKLALLACLEPATSAPEVRHELVEAGRDVSRPRQGELEEVAVQVPQDVQDDQVADGGHLMT